MKFIPIESFCYLIDQLLKKEKEKEKNIESQINFSIFFKTNEFNF